MLPKTVLASDVCNRTQEIRYVLEKTLQKPCSSITDGDLQKIIELKGTVTLIR